MADVITTFTTTELIAVNEILASVGQGPVNTLDDTNPDVAIIQRTLKQISREVQTEGWSFNKEYKIKTKLKPIAATDWVASTSGSTKTYTKNELRMNGDNLYRCSVTGASKVGGAGPVHTSGTVSEGTSLASWTYIDDGNKTQIEVPSAILQADLTDVTADYDPVIRHNERLTDPSQKVLVLYDRAKHTDRWDTTQDWEFDITLYYDFLSIPPVIQDYIIARTAAVVSSRIVGDSQQYQMLQQKEAYARAMALEYECNQGDYTFFGHSKTDTKNKYSSYKPYQVLQR